MTNGNVFFSGPKGVYGVPAQYERSFRWKLNQFRYLCQSNALPSHIKLSGTYIRFHAFYPLGMTLNC